jgi:hypothetical protein
MSLLHVHCMCMHLVFAACPPACLCCMSMMHQRFMSILYIHAACPCCMSLLHVYSASHICMPKCMSMLRVQAASCCFSMLHVCTTCTCCMHMLYFHAACTCCISMLHVLAAFPYCMPVLHGQVNAACLNCMSCCMSLLNVHAVYLYCMSMLHAFLLIRIRNLLPGLDPATHNYLNMKKISPFLPIL